MAKEQTKNETKNEKTKGVGKAIGIDLGTTFSAVAVMEGGKPTIISNSEGDRTTPSVVCIRNDERIVGKVARNQAIMNPDHTIRSIKRHMGDANFKVMIDETGTIISRPAWPRKIEKQRSLNRSRRSINTKQNIAYQHCRSANLSYQKIVS